MDSDTLIPGNEILSAMAEFLEPSTLNQIVSRIAKKTGLTKKIVEGAVKDPLEMGVKYGYVETCGDRFFSVNRTLDAVGSDLNVPSAASSETPSTPSNSKVGSKPQLTSQTQVDVAQDEEAVPGNEEGAKRVDDYETSDSEDEAPPAKKPKRSQVSKSRSPGRSEKKRPAKKIIKRRPRSRKELDDSVNQ